VPGPQGCGLADRDTAVAQRTLPSDTSPEGAVPAGAPAGLPQVPGYEILTELGRGTTGVVYKARQVGLGRLVALKMILAGSHAGKEQRERFLAEARVVASLVHPHIIQLYEVGLQQDLPYFSMELVEGGTLADRLTGAPQPIRQAADFVRTLARTMHIAHQSGIVYRDLKPANILLASPKRLPSQVRRVAQELGLRPTRPAWERPRSPTSAWPSR
jgi:serine/threonine-protein kinase